ncbi:LCP family protein [Virgibacillus litoralis]|uniref:Anionic cell wall polymer biosynthesis LytR-Cps2A-Psr (LCP) family protein n=1 Tax=Virgibacillus litoralis TaxID=578221 RepID=A0ABS4HFH3_9BACI|nr:LCP family protein [Virgibacillus litoralis]MBP1949655.1 anionic cell wall polymer biosynthesis LytR-Cps2A-Psr (LCP) family protein [Virgibacillus litoralis]
MNNKKLDKELFAYLDDEELYFTKQDREETITKIQKKHNRKSNFKGLFQSIGPVTATFLVIILSIGVLLPIIYSGDENDEIQLASKHNNNSFSVLLMGEEPRSRTSLNILLAYNSEDKSMKVVPVPRDTYVSIQDGQGETIKDKLIHAGAYGAGTKTVMATVSQLFNIPIDYYATIPAERLAKSLSLNNNDIKRNNFMHEIKENLTISKIKELVKQSETNITKDQFNTLYSDSISVETIDLKEGFNEKMINEIYYVEIEEDMLAETSSVLQEHLE